MASSKVSKTPFIPIRDNLLEYEKMLAELEQIRYKEDPENFYKETAYQKSIDGKIRYRDYKKKYLKYEYIVILKKE